MAPNITGEFGSDCRVRLRCHACQSSHVYNGPIQAGRHVGDVIVKGYTFNVDDIEMIWRPRSRGGPRRGAFRWRPLVEGALPPRWAAGGSGHLGE
jgi:hypothetical protein